MELCWTQNWSTQFDLNHARFGDGGSDVNALGIHAIYHMNNATSLGAFYTLEEGEGDDIDIFSIEMGHEVSAWDVEGYLGTAEDGVNADATIVGVMERTVLHNGYGFGAAYDRVSFDVADFGRVSVTLDRDVTPNTNLYLEIGTLRAEPNFGSDSEPFIGLGGTYTFGAERGATFGARGVSRILPGS